MTDRDDSLEYAGGDAGRKEPAPLPGTQAFIRGTPRLWTEEEREAYRKTGKLPNQGGPVIVDWERQTAYPSWGEYQAAREAERRGFGYYLAIFLIIVGAAACIVGCMYLGYLVFGGGLPLVNP